ncbi:MAG: DUF2079 domain-containing protein [Candidatus Alcyoniella australis]|nr:DUF2079 domain-containing protein [Candidatus Alcyoniella australis]
MSTKPGQAHNGPVTHYEGGSHFAVHFSPLLYVAALIFRIFPRPTTLLLINIAIVALGGACLWGYARYKFRNQAAPLLVLAVFLANPATIGLALSGFHVLTAALPLVVLAWWLAEKGSWRLALVPFALALIVREDVALAAAMGGLGMATIRDRRRIGLAAVLISIAWFIVVSGVIMPTFITDSGVVDDIRFSRFPDSFGGSLVQALGTLLTDPVGMVGRICRDTIGVKAVYVNLLFLPLLLLPLGAGRAMLIGLPALFVNLISSNGLQHNIHSQYSTLIVAALFLGLVICLSQRVGEKQRLAVLGLLLALNLLGTTWAAQWGAFSPAHKPDMCKWQDFDQSDREYLRWLEQNLPQDASLMASRSVSSHLGYRHEEFMIDVGTEITSGRYQLVLLDRTAQMPTRESAEIVFNYLGEHYICARPALSDGKRIELLIHRDYLPQFTGD